MKRAPDWAVHLLVGVLIAAIVVLAAIIITDHDSPTGEIGTALAIERELHCEEDEDIVISLAPNGLPVAYCRQVIER